MENKKIFNFSEQGKQKIFEIILTALLSAGIAFLTNILSQISAPTLPQTNIETAGLIGGIIRTIRNSC
jgi:hypothetical protein